MIGTDRTFIGVTVNASMPHHMKVKEIKYYKDKYLYLEYCKWLYLLIRCQDTMKPERMISTNRLSRKINKWRECRVWPHEMCVKCELFSCFIIYYFPCLHLFIIKAMSVFGFQALLGLISFLSSWSQSKISLTHSAFGMIFNEQKLNAIDTRLIES